jgi:hypothetical protein
MEEISAELRGGGDADFDDSYIINRLLGYKVV